MPEQVSLKRGISLPLLVFYGAGNILGAGIYVLIGKVAGIAHYHAPLAFVVASLVAAVTALTYAEISARLPYSAGEAVYVQEGLGRRWLSVFVGLLISAAGLVSAATMVHGFVGYLQVFVQLPDWLVITALILALGAVAAWGIAEAVAAAALLTLIEVAGLVLIIAVGAENLVALPERLPDLVPTADARAWQGVFVGAFLAFFAFIGFEDMVNVAEEVKQPRRNLPLGILLALAFSTVLYLVVSLVAVMTVSPATLEASAAPLAAVYQQATGREPVLISLISLFAVINGALIQMIMASRVLYGMSRRRWLPAWLGAVNRRTRTPLIATAVVTCVIWLLATWLPLITLAKATSFSILIVFFLVNLALWRIKRRDPHPQGVRVFPVWVPVTGLLLTAGLVMFELLF